MMITKNFLLTTLHDTPFLLPYGQAVATFSRGFQLNEAGALIVESLSQVEPFVWYAKKSGLTPDEMEEAREEYDVFLRQLAACGCLQANVRAFQFPEAEPLYGTLKIGPLTVRLQGNADFFSKEFTPFLVEDGTKYSKADMAVPPESNGKAVSSDNSVECISPKNQANVSTSVMREFCPDQTITVTEEVSGIVTFVQRAHDEQMPDASALIDRSQKEQTYYVYQLTNEGETYDMLDFLPAMGEDIHNYFLILRPEVSA